MSTVRVALIGALPALAAGRLPETGADSSTVPATVASFAGSVFPPTPAGFSPGVAGFAGIGPLNSIVPATVDGLWSLGDGGAGGFATAIGGMSATVWSTAGGAVAGTDGGDGAD
ncbi:MAG: hypothetical protein RLY70_4456, partial [Planctomycetota bacterium]